MVKVREDLTGKVFGRLTVIKQAEDYVNPNGTHYARWLCECDCEDKSLIITMGTSLKNKITQSCGCLQKERASLASKKYNKYDLSGEYGVGYISNNDEFYFDLEDYDKIKNHCWLKNKDGYIITNNKNKKLRSLHRIVMGVSDDFVVDHIHGEGSRHDNRKSNLRIATKQENNRNRKLCSTNTSGVTGVTFDKSRNKWCAQIVVNNKNIHLGRFNNFEDAVKARKEAEEKYFGEFSYDNSMKMLKEAA